MLRWICKLFGHRTGLIRVSDGWTYGCVRCGTRSKDYE